MKIVGGTDNANIYLETPGGGNTSTIFFGDAAASNAGYIKYDNNNQRMQFGIEASTKGTWNANGLGIGTTAPSMALHVNSSSYDVAEFSSSHSAGAKLILDADATGGTEFALQSTADGAGTGGGKLDFVNAGNSRMVLTAAGNVGIGTTSPAELFTISDATTTYMQFKPQATHNTWTIGADATGLAFYDSTVGGYRMSISDAGYVGIGTTSPNDLLDVRGNIQTSGTFFLSGSDLGGKIARVDTSEVGLYAATTEQIRLGVSNSYLKGTNWVFNGGGYFRVNSTKQLQFGDDEHYIYSDGTDLILKTVTTATNGIVIDSKVDTTQKIDGTTVATWTSTGLGIGTTAPAHKLSILDGTVGGFINPRSSTATVSMGAYTAHPLQFYAGGNEAIRVKSDGKVGIGTTAPDAKLHVYNGSAGSFTPDTDADDLIVENSTNAGITVVTPNANVARLVFASPSDTIGMELKWRGTDNQVTFGAKNSGDSLVLTSGDGVTALTFDSSQIATFANTPVVGTMTSSDNSTKAASTAYVTTAVAAAGGGDVSKVGTPVDNQLAVWTGANTIEGNANITYNGTVVDINGNLRVQDGHTLAAGDNDDVFLYHDTNATLRNNTGIFNINQNSASDMSINANGGDIVIDSNIYNKNGGNVGIGTSAPAYTLDVNGAINTDQDYYLKRTGGAFYYQNNAGTNLWALYETSGDLAVYDYQGGGAQMVTFKNGGNVGIGTTSPDKLLHIHGGTDTAFKMSNNGTGQGGSDGFEILQANAGEITLKNRESAALKFDTAGTNRMSIKGTGLIGIGTDNPSTLLDVVNTSSNWAMLVDQNNTGNLAMKIQGNYGLGISSEGQYPLDISTASSSDALRMLDNGNLGIGTITPEGVLHTANNSGVNIFQRSNDSASYGTNLYVRKSRGTVGSESNTQSGDLIGQMAFSPYYGDYDNYAASISSAIEGTVTTDTTPGRLMFSTAAAGANTVTERMRIDSAGKVGIGTSSPSYKLDLGDKFFWDSNYFRTNQTRGAAIMNEAPSSTNPVFSFYGDEDTGMSRADNNKLSLITAGVEAIRIDASQNVGIGTTTPDKKLHVVGTTRLAGNAIVGTESGNDLICRFIHGRDSGSDNKGDLFINYNNPNRVYIGYSGFGESDLRLYGDFQIYDDTTNWLTADTSAAQVDMTGTLNVTGTISATAKSFNIPHPLYKDKRLVHGSLEGPEHGIYIRGSIETEEKGCLVELPEYWSAMCEDYTVQLTPHGPYTVYIKEKLKDKVMIECSQKKFKFDYYIVGARTDETLEVVKNA